MCSIVPDRSSGPRPERLGVPAPIRPCAPAEVSGSAVNYSGVGHVYTPVGRMSGEGCEPSSLC